MPRKNNEKYENYEMIKQYYDMQMLWANLGEIGHSFSDEWHHWSSEVTAELEDVVDLENRIFDINHTSRYFGSDKSNLLNRGKKLAANIEMLKERVI